MSELSIEPRFSPSPRVLVHGCATFVIAPFPVTQIVTLSKAAARPPASHRAAERRKLDRRYQAKKLADR